MLIKEILFSATGILAGALIGLSFGIAQQTAYRRYKQRQTDGTFDSGWAAIPGSMRRVAYLLMALAVVQLVCPLMFSNGTQWWVSAGVIAGYGTLLYKNLREKLAARH